MAGRHTVSDLRLTAEGADGLFLRRVQRIHPTDAELRLEGPPRAWTRCVRATHRTCLLRTKASPPAGFHAAAPNWSTASTTTAARPGSNRNCCSRSARSRDSAG